MDLFLKKAAPTYTEVRNSLDVKSGINSDSDELASTFSGSSWSCKAESDTETGFVRALGLDPLILGLTL